MKTNNNFEDPNPVHQQARAWFAVYEKLKSVVPHEVSIQYRKSGLDCALESIDYLVNQARVERTPSSKWKQEGEPDPHGNSYDCERAKLAMGYLTDDELANGAFMNYDVRPSLEAIIAGRASSPIAWMTAVKDRIRWLSRQLEKKNDSNT